MAPPLARFTRPPEIEAAIDDILLASRDEIRRRLQIADRGDPEHLPAEVVLFLVRRSRHDNRDRWFEELYPALKRHLERALPRGDDLRTQEVAERVARRFGDLLLADRHQPDDALDFYECRFAMAIARLRADAKRAVYVRSPKFEPVFEDGGRISDQVASAIERLRRSSGHLLDDIDFRSELLAAIDGLPENERRTVTLMLKGLNDYDQNPDVETISRELKKSARMIQNYRTAAVEKLRRALLGNEQ